MPQYGKLSGIGSTSGIGSNPYAAYYQPNSQGEQGSGSSNSRLKM